MNDPQIDRMIVEMSLYQCLECGKCTASCPRRLSGKEYSPRLLAHKVIAEREDNAYIENAVWECLTCGMCRERCPSGVEFNRFILEMRTLLAKTKGLKGYRAHDGALHSWMRMMTAPGLVQNRLAWLGEDLQTDPAGEVAFFTGCAPYFDVFFAGLQVDTLAIVRDSIRLLNFMDIKPAVLPNERCCGHDLLWTGDRENFEALCRMNYRSFKDAGVRQLVVTCPECYNVLSEHMPEVIPGFDLEVHLLHDLLLQEFHKGGLALRPLRKQVVFQDPCRLTRLSAHRRNLRELLGLIPQLTIVKEGNGSAGSPCCGNCGFINCDAYSKQIQVQRLREAQSAGAELLITACPKCMIHLTCAARDPLQQGKIKTVIRDLVSVLAERIEWYSGEETGKRKARWKK